MKFGWFNVEANIFTVSKLWISDAYNPRLKSLKSWHVFNKKTGVLVTWKHEFNAYIKINQQVSRPWTGQEKATGNIQVWWLNGSCQFARPCSNHVYIMYIYICIYIKKDINRNIYKYFNPGFLFLLWNSWHFHGLRGASCLITAPVLPYHPVPARSLSNSPSGAYFGNPSSSPLITTYKQVINRRDALINLNLNTKQKCTPKLVLLRLF